MFLLALGRLISLISGWAGRNRTAAPVFASMLTVSLLLSTGTSPAWGGSFLAHCPGDGGGGEDGDQKTKEHGGATAIGNGRRVHVALVG